MAIVGGADRHPPATVCSRQSHQTGKSGGMDLHHWWRFRDGKVYYYRGTEDTAAPTAKLLSDD